MTDNEIISIDEAIRHCYETYFERDDLCRECREEHKQLAKWLEELKESRNTINRQKAEIERWKEKYNCQKSKRNDGGIEMNKEWKSQQSDGKYSLQFETDDIEKYRFVEKAAQMAVDGKTTVGIVHCKDCRSYSKATHECNRFYRYCENYDYCSSGIEVKKLHNL